MATIKVIIQGGPGGLGIAATYYKQFPAEPSPAGDMDLSGASFVEVKNITFDSLLEELAKAPTGGTVLIVCHAHDESGSLTLSSGLFMPLAKGAGLSAQDDAFQHLLEAQKANQKAKTIRAMPAGSDQEKKAKSDAWIGLATDFSLGFPPDGATLAQLERFFEKGLEEVAKNNLKLSGGAAGLKTMLGHIEKVQLLKLERVEFRSCNIGKDTETLKHLKELFGCGKLLAPTAKTFYLDRMPIMTLDRFDRQFVSDHPADFRGGSGTFKDPNDFFVDVIRKNPKVRLFWDVEYGYIAPVKPQHDGGTTTIKLKGRVLGMVVEKVHEHPSLYRGSGGTWHEDARHKPLWDDAKKFVQQYMMKQATYSSGGPMIAGLWTPDDELPWLLPTEPEYVDHINMV